MIIFGWGHNKLKEYGPVVKRLDQHCNNEVWFNLVSNVTWGTLYFIPVIPYAKKSFLVCPICTNGYELTEEQFNLLKPMAILNQQFIDQKITEAEYEKQRLLLEKKET